MSSPCGKFNEKSQCSATNDVSESSVRVKS